MRAMIKFNNVSLRRGSKLLFEQVNLFIHPGQRVGLTGANGTGKTSLFALLRDELHAENGTCDWPQSWQIAHVAQETPAVSLSAIDYVLLGDAELTSLNQALAEAESKHDGEAQSHLHEQLQAIDAYTANSRAAKLLHGLGFKPGQENRPVTDFSGGWRMRLNLAQALMCRSSLLLLDEPTNHLDLEAVYWLEEWLRGYQGTLIVISHDRDFLDRVVTHVAHIEQQQIKLYTGNYSAFEVARAAHLANQQSAYQKQQRDIAHMRSFVTRFKAKATKAKQAQSRVKALERMELIAPAHVDSPFAFNFLPPERLSHPLISLERTSVGYQQTPLLEGIKMNLAPGDRIGLLGPNGAGKSTFIKLLAGVLPATSGKRKEARDIVIGYFAQHQLEQLRPEDSPLKHLLRLDPMASEQELRNFLGGFGFHGDKALESVAPFSGGEKARLVLAILVYQRPAVLLLDEPTNHLDLEMRLALTIALQSYEGALVVVSHDRHLLRSVTDELWLVDGGTASAFDGDLDDYRAWLSQRDKPVEKVQAASNANKKLDRQAAAQRRQKLQPLRNTIKQAETKMDKLQTQLSQLESQLADNDLYNESEKDRLKQLLAEQAEVKTALETTELEWFEATEALESAELAEE
jgi:ATP-binding cassette subfamily F protein 3